MGLPPSAEELQLIQPILAQGMYETPNICYHIYKVRRGSWNKIKLYLYFDGATCRTKELFCTDNQNNLLDIRGTNLENILDETIDEEPFSPFDEEVGEETE